MASCFYCKSPGAGSSGLCFSCRARFNEGGSITGRLSGKTINIQSNNPKTLEAKIIRDAFTKKEG